MLRCLWIFHDEGNNPISSKFEDSSLKNCKLIFDKFLSHVPWSSNFIGNLNRRPQARTVPQDGQETSKNKKRDEDDDNWELPEGDLLPYWSHLVLLPFFFIFFWGWMLLHIFCSPLRIVAINVGSHGISF